MIAVPEIEIWGTNRTTQQLSSDQESWISGGILSFTELGYLRRQAEALLKLIQMMFKCKNLETL